MPMERAAWIRPTDWSAFRKPIGAARLGWLLLAVASRTSRTMAEDTEHEEHHRDYQLEDRPRTASP